jgi:hypothetical protein
MRLGHKHGCEAYGVDAAVLGWELQTEMKGHMLRRRTYVLVPQLSESRPRVWMLYAGLEDQLMKLSEGK